MTGKTRLPSSIMRRLASYRQRSSRCGTDSVCRGTVITRLRSMRRGRAWRGRCEQLKGEGVRSQERRRRISVKR